MNPNPLQLGAAGEAIIKQYEASGTAPRLVAYPDSKGIPTIAWGHRYGVQLGDTCTVDQAEAWFRADTATAVHAVNESLTVAVTQNEFDALVCFTYNVGEGNEGHSTLLQLLNAGDVNGAAQEFPKWDLGGGKVVPGLWRRRLAEQALFLKP